MIFSFVDGCLHFGRVISPKSYNEEAQSSCFGKTGKCRVFAVSGTMRGKVHYIDKIPPIGVSAVCLLAIPCKL
jgi:hypothetical protein